MNKDNNCFIGLLSSFINGQEPKMQEKPNWEQVYKLAKIHDASRILYLMINKLQEEYKPSQEILNRIKKEVFSTALVSEVQKKRAEVIINVLNEAQIPHIFVKGFVVKNYYPIKEMRTMGDIDILIKPQDREKAHNLFLDLGYIPGYILGEVWDYTKGPVHIEVHTKLVYHNLTNGIDYVQYFSDVWEHVIQGSRPYTFELKMEYHYLYLMEHIAKHFDGRGCGIRMIMDIAVLHNYFKGSLDWRYINTELEKLNLGLFSKNIFLLCSKWFGISFDFPLSNMDDELYNNLCQYILSGGTYGFNERNQLAYKIRNEYSDIYMGDKKLIKMIIGLRYAVKRFFPDYKSMTDLDYCSFVRNRPLLLPIAWIYRFLYCALFRSRKSLNTLKDIVGVGKENEKQSKLMSRSGL
jgi:hypothetical protein